MSLLAQIRASNAQLTEATTPGTAVLIGATDGIGKRALVTLVSHGFPLKAYVIGRNKARDQTLLGELYAINNKVELVYLEGQISLMSEVERLTSYILEKEQKIDLLFHSAGFLPLLGRQETDEGLELSTAVAHFSRLAFILRLLPRLQAAAKSRVRAIFSAAGATGGDGAVPPAATPSARPLSQWTPEEAGEKALYLMTSAEYGGKGVNVTEGRSAGLTVTHQIGESLFSVNDVMKNLQQDTLLADLEAMGAQNAIWDYSVKTLAPWL
ncbi:hypothetical protein RAB80_010165 [Fusarium oxysporum f. sp. vasinfectum]|nr:hypothetical protein RAB80_010165 [Fusarium oxysporum f. sp. vasinfectum]